MAKEYREKVETELRDICQDVLVCIFFNDWLIDGNLFKVYFLNENPKINRILPFFPHSLMNDKEGFFLDVKDGMDSLSTNFEIITLFTSRLASKKLSVDDKGVQTKNIISFIKYVQIWLILTF